jgi:hypothetical protein
MQVRSCFVHLVASNTMVKTEFKMDIIWIRLIILKFLYYVTADMDHLHVKRIHLEPLVGHLHIVREDIYTLILSYII